MSTGPHRYRPGAGFGIVSPRTVILMDPDADTGVISKLWEVLLAGESPNDIVDEVLSIGLRNLRSIGMVHVGEQSTHLLVRGSVRAVTGSPDEPELLSADGALTWVEQAVPLGSLVTLSLIDASDGESLPIMTGIVRADTVSVGEVPSSIAVGELQGQVSEPTGSPTRVLPVQPPAESPAYLPPQALPLETLSATEINELAEPSAGAMDEIQDSHEPSSPPAVEDDFEDLFGATRAPRPVEDAAVRPVEEEEPSPGPVSVPDEEVPDPTFTSPQVEPTPDVSEASATGSRLIDSVPGIVNSVRVTPRQGHAVAAVPASEPPPSEDDAELTVAKAQLVVQRAESARGESRSGPTVHGIMCPSGHPNPATAARCRLCGASVDPVDPITMPRPVLGVLRFSTGMEVALDRTLIVGRSPRAERVSASEIPHLVAVPSPEHDISRDHLEVRIDGWHVLVKDLRSTNGTVIISPGQPPERLRGGEEVPIIPGTMVTMADEVNFLYEVE